MIRLWEFLNGKMGLNSSKIDRDTAKSVKLEILKNNSFCLKIVFFLTKTVIFQNFTFYTFLLYLGQFFSCINPFYHFGILKVSSLKWHTVCLIYARKKVLRNENIRDIFYATDSRYAKICLDSYIRNRKIWFMEVKNLKNL